MKFLRRVEEAVANWLKCNFMLILIPFDKNLRYYHSTLVDEPTNTIEEYSAKRGLSPIWFISRKMAKQDFVYHCWQWLAVTLK